MITALRRALRSLTLRGRCLLAAGLTAFATGLVVRERDLLRIAALLVALPLIAAIFAARTRFRLTCTRHIDPARLGRGDRSRVVLRIENVSRLPTGVLLVEDTIPYLLGGRPRVVLNRLAPHRPVDVGYFLSGEVRGRYDIGPLTVRLMDPFGLCEVRRAFTATDTLVVTPKVERLAPLTLRAGWGTAGHNTTRAVATHGDDDVATREYRHGDDLRRIHWRTTARLGALNVRREEQPWQSRGTVLLDTRAVGHGGDGPTSSLEWAISAAASVSVHLAHSGLEIRLVTDTGVGVGSTGRGTADFEGAVLDALAVTRASNATTLRAGTAALRHQGSGGLLVAVVGALSPDEAEHLARSRSSQSPLAIAFVLDPVSWAIGAHAGQGSPPGDGRATAELLRASGWRTVEVKRGDQLPVLWPQAAGTLLATSRTSVIA
ncbi:MAG TPA: DUF58 domain-containing protein [Mycobacteriales bacterium]|nr:DUF58 domain-containing protein [Mycobacteriales bacterium]